MNEKCIAIARKLNFPRQRIDIHLVIGYSQLYSCWKMNDSYVRSLESNALKSGTITRLACLVLLRIIDAALETFETSRDSSVAHDSFSIAGWSLGRRMHVLVRISHGYHVGRPGNERRNLSGVRPVLSPHWVISLLFLAVVANGAAQPGDPEISPVSLTRILHIDFKSGYIKRSGDQQAAWYFAARLPMLSSLIALD